MISSPAALAATAYVDGTMVPVALSAVTSCQMDGEMMLTPRAASDGKEATAVA